MPASQAARINFGALDRKSNKMAWCYCLKVALNYAINLHKDFACARKIIDVACTRSVLKAGGFRLFSFKTCALQSNFALKIYECAGSPPL